jgi:deoxyxylulose-5-phosphate synthase
MSNTRKLVVMEEVCAHSGIKEALSLELNGISACEVCGIDLGHRYVTHGSLQELYASCGLDGQSVANYVLEERK